MSLGITRLLAKSAKTTGNASTTTIVLLVSTARGPTVAGKRHDDIQHRKLKLVRSSSSKSESICEQIFDFMRGFLSITIGGVLKPKEAVLGQFYGTDHLNVVDVKDRELVL